MGINIETFAKWRKRQTVEDARMGPKEAHSTVLSIEEESVIVAFRRHTLLPFDYCLYALQPSIPHLTRSSLHLCRKAYTAIAAKMRAPYTSWSNTANPIAPSSRG